MLFHKYLQLLMEILSYLENTPNKYGLMTFDAQK